MTAALPANWTWATVGTNLPREAGYETLCRLQTPQGRRLAFCGASDLVERPAEVWCRYIAGSEEADEDGTRWTAPAIGEGTVMVLGAAIWEACAGDPGTDDEAFGRACAEVAAWLLGGVRAEWTYWLEDEGRVGARRAA